MSKMRFYKIDINYIKYLHSIDYRVQYNAGREDAYTENRPYVGVVLSVNGKNYFAPMEHPRPEHQKLKNSKHIFRIYGGRYGLIGINNMLPVPQEQLISFDINTSPRRKVLMEQFIYCQKHFAELTEKAHVVYQRRQHPNAFEEKIYCDFAKLEAAADLYKSTQQITPEAPAEQNKADRQDNSLDHDPLSPSSQEDINTEGDDTKNTSFTLDQINEKGEEIAENTDSVLSMSTDAPALQAMPEAPAEQNKTAQQDNSLDHDPLSPSSQEDINTEGYNAKNTSSTLDQIKANAAEEIVENTDPILSTTKEPAVQPNYQEKISEQDEAARQGSSLAPDQPSQPSKDDVKIEKDNTKNTTSSLDKIETSAAEETAAPSNNLEKSNIQEQLEVEPGEIDRQDSFLAPAPSANLSKDDSKTEKDNTKKPMSMLDSIKARGEEYQKENQQQPKTKEKKEER